MLTQRQKENISMATELTRIASKKLQDAGKISSLDNSNQHSWSNKGGLGSIPQTPVTNVCFKIFI